MTLLCDINDKEPFTYEEATKYKEWKDSTIEEYHLIMNNDVWERASRPKKKYVVTSKWIYKIRHVPDGSIEKYKEIFVTRGFSRKEGVDYEETFAPMERYTSIRSILALVVVIKWKIHQMDVKSTFLNGVVMEEVCVEQPLGFKTRDRKTHV